MVRICRRYSGVAHHQQHGKSGLQQTVTHSFPRLITPSVLAADILCKSNPTQQQAAGSKRKRAAAEGSAIDAEESGQSGGLSGEGGDSSEEGTSGVKASKPASAKKRANPRKPSNPMRSAIDEGSTGSDAKKVCCCW